MIQNVNLTEKQQEQLRLATLLGKEALFKGFKEPIECKETIMFLAARKEPIDLKNELSNKDFLKFWMESWNFEFGQYLMSVKNT